MQMPSEQDIIIFSNGDFDLRENYTEKDFDGRRGSYLVAMENGPWWCEKAKALGIID